MRFSPSRCRQVDSVKPQGNVICRAVLGRQRFLCLGERILTFATVIFSASFGIHA